MGPWPLSGEAGHLRSPSVQDNRLLKLLLASWRPLILTWGRWEWVQNLYHARFDSAVGQAVSWSAPLSRSCSTGFGRHSWHDDGQQDAQTWMPAVADIPASAMCNSSAIYSTQHAAAAEPVILACSTAVRTASFDVMTPGLAEVQ